jgi:hypothetical protein
MWQLEIQWQWLGPTNQRRVERQLRSSATGTTRVAATPGLVTATSRSGNGNYDPRNGNNDPRNGNYDSRYGSRGGLRLVSLPETFRIDSNRRDLRLEDMNGQTLRQIDSGRNRQLSSQQTIYGATIYETYSLVDHGQRMMVHTTITGAQGTRDMTHVYDRA